MTTEAFRILGDVQRLNLGPGDVVLIRLARGPHDTATLEKVRAEALQLFPHNKILVVDDETGVQVIGKAQACD